MAISSAGLGSGLDVNSIVTQLMAVERQPLSQMKTEADKLQTKVSAYGKMQSLVSTFRDAAAKLARGTTWNSVAVNSADATSVSAAGSAANGSAGTYSVAVSALASGQATASGAFASKAATVGSGSLSIELGTWNAGQTGFTAKSGSSPINVTVAATDTLTQVRDKINAAGAGVQATIVSDASGSRLVMRSSSTGEENAFRITATDDDGNNTNAAGLSALAYDPSAGATAMSRTQAAGNAQATINGMAITSSSNTLTDVIDGVSLKLSKVTTAPVDVTVSADTETLKTTMTDFAKAYNDLASFLTSQTKYDATSKKGATFQGDSGVNSIRTALRNLGTSSGGASSALTRLADVGFDIQADGTLKTDSAKLTAALTKVDDLRKMFADVGTTDGYAASFRKWGDNLLSVDGSLSTRSSSMQTQLSNNSKKQATFEDRMTSVEKRMRAQYSALDKQMSGISTMSNYLTQQMTAWSKS